MVLLGTERQSPCVRFGLISGYLAGARSGRQRGGQGDGGLHLAGIQFPGKRKSSLISRHGAARIAAQASAPSTHDGGCQPGTDVIAIQPPGRIQNPYRPVLRRMDLQRYLLPTTAGSVSHWNLPYQTKLSWRSTANASGRSRYRYLALPIDSDPPPPPPGGGGGGVAVDG